MENYELGDIYYIDLAYQDNPNESKRRPAIIIDIDESSNTLYTLVATTSQGPENPPKIYDQFKYPIFNWRKAGLTKPSWCKCYSTIELPAEAFLEYVGSLEDGDYNRLIDFLETVD